MESDICIKASIGFSCCDGKISLFLEDSPWLEERVQTHTLIKMKYSILCLEYSMCRRNELPSRRRRRRRRF